MRIPLNGLPSAAIVLDAEDRIADANSSAEALLGLTVHDLRTRSVHEVLPGFDAGRTEGAPFEAGDHVVRAVVGDPIDGGSDERVLLLFDVSALTASIDTARRIARSRTEFLGNLGHEIRSAVASMIGFSEMLQEDVTASNRELARVITRSGRHLIDTLNAVMDLARVEFDEAEIELSHVDVVARARDRVNILMPDAGEKGIDLIYVPSVSEMYARVNPIFLDRILHNLIDNAIKYTDRGRVEVDIERRDDRIWLYVADTGRGMDASFIPRLFAPFEREYTEDEKEEGTGLGLAVTRSLVELMDGHIFACSTPGEGSTFTVSFPEPEETDAADA